MRRLSLLFLLNSNGMDIYIDNTDGQSLEYNIIGGVLDLYFIAGPSPRDVATQYAAITQHPLMVPYWGLGFHQCKYGYRDVYEVAAVVANYSEAGIPLETMWTDSKFHCKGGFTSPARTFPHAFEPYTNQLLQLTTWTVVASSPLILRDSLLIL